MSQGDRVTWIVLLLAVCIQIFATLVLIVRMNAAERHLAIARAACEEARPVKIRVGDSPSVPFFGWKAYRDDRTTFLVFPWETPWWLPR